MKLKLTLDVDSIKQGFLNHLEKILFGCVVFCFLVFVYRAIGRERLGITPDDMRNQAAAAQSNVRDAKADPPVAKQYLPAVQPSTTAVNESRYDLIGVLNPPIFHHAKRRGNPDLFPLEKLKGSAGIGGFAMADTSAAESMGGGVGLKGQRWAVLVGLVPWQKQLDAYKTQYEDTLPRELALQHPQYYYFKVQRAVVDPLDDSAAPKWKDVGDDAEHDIHVRRAMENIALWRGGSGSIDVDTRFQLEPLGSTHFTFPLGPLQNRSWGNEVAYPPEIPLALLSFGEGAAKAGEKDAKKDDGKIAEGKTPAKKMPPREVRPDDPDEPDAMPAGPAGMAGPGGMGGAGGAGGMGMMKMAPMGGGTGGGGPSPADMMRMMGGGAPAKTAPSRTGGMGGIGGMGAMAGMAGGKTGMGGMTGMGGRAGTGGFTEEVVEEPQYKLFRFFDFTVEPGNLYRYRVQLRLVNPNRGLPPQYLEKESFGKEKSISTPWSEQSPVIAVPRDSQALLVGAKPSDGSATVLVVNVDPQDGATSCKDNVSVQRGQFLDFRNEPFNGVEAGGRAGMMTAAAGADGEEAPRKVNYFTEMVYLDSTGGQRLIGRQSQDLEPAQALLLAPDGRLIVRNEIDDVPEVVAYKSSAGEGAGASTAGGMTAMGPARATGTGKGAKGKSADADLMKMMMNDSGTGKTKPKR